MGLRGGSSGGVMAAAFVIETKGGATTTFTTAGVDTSGGNLVVVVVGYSVAGGIPAISDNKSGSYTQIGTGKDNGTNGVVLFYAKNVACGANHQFTVTGGSFCAVCVEVFSGTDATSPKDQSNESAGSGGTTHQPGSITPTTNGQVLVTGLANGVGTENLTVDNSFITVNNNQFSGGVHYGVSASYTIQSTAAAINPTWTSDASSTDAAAISSFKAAAVASTGGGMLLLIG